MCCYRDIKNYERFNLIVQSMICLTVCQLKSVQLLIESKPNVPAVINNYNNGVGVGGNAEKSETPSTEIDKKIDEFKIDPKVWSLPEVEKLLILISKAFLLNFPLYIAYKHGVHSRLDDISAQEAQV